ncbi:DUF3618 domain-containing protein [Streptomyces sp. NPDC006207]
MTSDKSPTTDELRERVEATREELGRTVAALSAKTDVKGRLAGRAGQAGAKAHEAASRIGELVREKTPEPARDKAVEAARRMRLQAVRAGRLARTKAPAVRARAGRTARAARSHRAPLLGAGAAMGVLLLVRRARRRRG